MSEGAEGLIDERERSIFSTPLEYSDGTPSSAGGRMSVICAVYQLLQGKLVLEKDGENSCKLCLESCALRLEKKEVYA
jgi:hypothetical protein